MRKKPAVPGKRILVVEDMPENLRLFQVLLRLEGAAVLGAERATDGIELARQEQPDLILMDLQMPGMDGVEAIQELRNDPATMHTPIVVVTASAMAEDRIKSMEAGADGFVTKPVEPEVFGPYLAQLMDQKQITKRARDLV